MAFTKEIVDFTGLDHGSIKSKLSELNIPLSADEALMIQNEMLGRPPSLTELILFSIQGSEHCSYKSSRKHRNSLLQMDLMLCLVQKKMPVWLLLLQIIMVSAGALL